MAKRRVLVGALALLGSCERPDAAAPDPTPRQKATEVTLRTARGPDLAKCKRLDPHHGSERQRTAPLAFPRKLADIVVSDMDRIGVATLGGQTWCIDARLIEDVNAVALSPDKRFLSFDWTGYELFGHVIVDRSGAGREVDTGVAPLPSPSARRLAALDYSESAYGALNAFAVWDIGPATLRQVAKIEKLPQAYDWRIDRWVGENCLELSAIDWDDLPEAVEDHERAPRQRYVARPSGRAWQIRPATEGACPAA